VDSSRRTDLDALLSEVKTMSTFSRRQFGLIAGAGLAIRNLGAADKGKVTAGEVVERIKKNIGIPWNYGSIRDTFKIGGPEMTVNGIATSFGGNFRVMQLAQKAGLNMVIVHEPTYYSDADALEPVKNEEIYRIKEDFAKRNNMVVWRIHDHWHAHVPDGIRAGWNHDLGWDKYLVKDSDRAWELPPTTLGELAKLLATKLGSRSIRVVGDPNLRVAKIGYGSHNLDGNIAPMNESDCVIISEAREYDSFEFVRDAVYNNPKKSAIIISHQLGEDVGMDELARWLTPIVPEIPVKFVATTDEYWTV
jgi:putative NIF3 family GTP cyclohydrolase 1 type 2